jgi:hypothetical protein
VEQDPSASAEKKLAQAQSLGGGDVDDEETVIRRIPLMACAIMEKYDQERIGLFAIWNSLQDATNRLRRPP